MNQNELLEKLFEEIRGKLSDGWIIESLSVSRAKTDGDKKVIYVEVEVLEQ